MQKRLLALVATVAMALSMFAGIAFAAPEDQTLAEAGIAVEAVVGVAGSFVATNATTQANLTAAVDAVVTGDGIGFTIEDFTLTPATAEAAGTIAGTVKLTKTSEADVEVTIARPIAQLLTYKFRLDNSKVIAAPNGYQLITGAIVKNNNSSAGEAFKVTIAGTGTITNATFDTDANGYFSVYVDRNLSIQDLVLSATPKVGALAVTDGKIEVRYNVTITSDRPNLGFTYTGKQEPVVITGKVTDFNGNAVEGAKVAVTGVAATPALDTVTTLKDGIFGFTTLKWNAAGTLKLDVASAATPTVFKTHLEGKVAGIVATVSVSPGTTVHTVSDTVFTVKGSGFAAGNVDFKVQNADKVDQHTFTATADENGNIVANSKFTWGPTAPGNYTLIATQTNHEAKATITVSNPATYNLIGADALTKLPVGDKVFSFGVGGDNRIDLTQFTPGGVPETHQNFKYTVLVDGKATTLKATDDDKGTVGQITVTSTKLAERTIQVIAYALEDGHYTKAVFNQAYTAKVDGWAVELDVTSLTAGKTQDLTLVVKDKDGLPVNNATIVIDSTPTFGVNPSNYNAQNGTYVIKDVKINAVGKYDVTVYLGETVPANAKATLKLDVVGEKLYAVTSDIATLLQGKAEDVKVTITQDGVAVTPARVKLIDKDGNPTEFGFSLVEAGVIKIKEAVATAGTYTLRIENFNGTVCGDTTIEVVAPKLVLIDEEVEFLTNNLKTTVKFKVVDPRDDSVIKDNITTVLGTYIPTAEFTSGSGAALGNPATLLGAEEHVLTILPKVTADDFEAAAKAKKTVKLTFKVGETTVNGGFEVKNATITSDPGMIVIGAQNNLTLTYEDANGNPIADKKVVAVGTPNIDLGKTNEDGQVIYPVGIVAAAVKVEADTDVDAANAKVSLTIKIGYDTEAPKVTHEVNGDKATLVITDNVRLVRVNIGGKEIDFWPGAKYVHNVTLKPGVNKFAVKAQDSNDNVLDEVVEIEYKTDAVVLKGEQVQRQGDFLFVQARQFEEFGAKFAWNGTTRTATFVIGDTKVEVTIGSTTAMVNGKAVTMPAAPFISGDRTYVPTRFIAEQLGWNVHWAAGDVVTITLP